VFWKRREQAKEPSTSLFDPTKIDLISASPEGVVSLLIVQDQPWANTPDELQSLLQKLDNYVHFVVTGALATRDPSLARASWRILIDTYAGAPHDATIRALRERADALPADALGLILHELEPPMPPATSPKSVRARRLSAKGDEDVML
jgi:hypothetical protein